MLYMSGLAAMVMLMTTMMDAPREISFSTQDGGTVYADLYEGGERGVVLAHGARFDKSSWAKQAHELAHAGFRTVAIDFRGYGKSRGGTQSRSPQDDLYLDVLAAVRYFRENGATSVAVVGGSMGGGAAAEAVVRSKPGTIDRLVLLAHAPIQHPERLTGPKLFAAGQGDPITPRVREQYEKAPEPKELLILDTSAHAQFLFTTDQGERLMREILRFLSVSSTVAR
jgi:pimeloyl-ACP methyl ester carboxylesterase